MISNSCRFQKSWASRALIALCALTTWLAPASGFAQLDADETDVPSWFKRGSYVEQGVTYVMLRTDGFHSEPAARKAIGETAYNHVLNHFAMQLGESPTVELAAKLGVNQQRVLNELISDEFTHVGLVKETISSSVVDESYRAYFRLKLDPDFVQSAEENFKDEVTRKRLVSTGVAGGAVLSILAILFGYLRLNHATRGFYSRRLQMGAGILAVITGVLCFAVLSLFGG